MNHSIDVMILGGGSAAFAAALKASELDATVSIIESNTLGGTCVNVGCVPSKMLIRAAEQSHTSAKGNPRRTHVDWEGIIQQKDALVSRLQKEKYIDIAASHPSISIIHGEAHFNGRRSISVNGTTYAAGKILVATGSSPWVPPISGLKENGYLDSTAALSLPALPESMIVIGGGSIGLELAQMFARFGVQVTILEVLPRIAASEEPEISNALQEYLRQENIRVLTSVKIQHINKVDDRYFIPIQWDGKTEALEAKQLLVATGRRPNTSHLNLESAGVQTGKHGAIAVNEYLQTTNPDIFAAGDVIGDPMLVYVGAHAGKLAAENALTTVKKTYDLSVVPRVTFTDPQIASVGLTEAQARENRHTVRTSIIFAEDVPRALVGRDNRGLIKLVVDKQTGKILGAHVLATEAGEVIQTATLAIRGRLTYRDIIETYHPYLTWVEGIKLAAIALEKDLHQLSCCAA